jgi:hypothetical protein
MYKLHAQHASASESGDYFQVLFEERRDVDDGRCFLIQRQFEFPDGGRCTIQTEREDMCGHFRVRHASLKRARFQVAWVGAGENQAEITFEADDESFTEICKAMRIMIPEIEFTPNEAKC